MHEAGIGYWSFIELRNLLLDFEDWRKWYAKMLESCGELLTGRLAGIPEPYCLLCAEKRIAECHRQQIADYLVSHKGTHVTHLE